MESGKGAESRSVQRLVYEDDHVRMPGLLQARVTRADWGCVDTEAVVADAGVIDAVVITDVAVLGAVVANTVVVITDAVVVVATGT